MARTHRAHLPMARLRKRGGRTNIEERDRAQGKSQKQRRANERVGLRKEHL